MKNLKKIITKVSETKSWFFENVKLINLQSDSSRVAKRRLVNKIRNERQEVTTDVTDIFHQSLVMCKRDVLWKEEGKLVMRTEVDSLEYIRVFWYAGPYFCGISRIFVEFQEFSWNRRVSPWHCHNLDLNCEFPKKKIQFFFKLSSSRQGSLLLIKCCLL